MCGIWSVLSETGRSILWMHQFPSFWNYWDTKIITLQMLLLFASMNKPMKLQMNTFIVQV